MLVTKKFIAAIIRWNFHDLTENVFDWKWSKHLIVVFFWSISANQLLLKQYKIFSIVSNAILLVTFAIHVVKTLTIQLYLDWLLINFMKNEIFIIFFDFELYRIHAISRSSKKFSIEIVMWFSTKVFCYAFVEISIRLIFENVLDILTFDVRHNE